MKRNSLTTYIAAVLLLLMAGSLVAERDETSAVLDSMNASRDRIKKVTRYLDVREVFKYPRTGRDDPFDLPLGKPMDPEGLGISVNELTLDGVLFSTEASSIAIMSLPNGQSFLVRTGDRIGIATVTSIALDQINFQISQYGVITNISKQLKPLVEDQDGTTEQTDSGEAGQAAQEGSSGTAQGQGGNNDR